MQFSISFQLPINEIQWQSVSLKSDWDLINSQIASSTANATWWTAIFTFAAVMAAGISAYLAWKAVNTWRNQTLGEHEFGRLLDAMQALHDIEATISNFRLPVIREGETITEKSLNFRKDMTILPSKLLKATVGLDQIWDTSFKTARDQLLKLTTDIALAANYVFESTNRMAQDEHRALVGQYSATEESSQQLKNAKLRIDNDIAQVRNFLVTRLKAYKTK
jgi:hypothetical protein